jgi:hypothetical protein
MTTEVACTPTSIVLAVLLATEIDVISLKEMAPITVELLTPEIVSVLNTPSVSRPEITKELPMSFPLHFIFILPFKAFEFF